MEDLAKAVDPRARFKRRTVVDSALLPWTRSDTLLIAGLLVAAAMTRFISLGSPSVFVFDERSVVEGGARIILGGGQFLSTHPPFPAEMIALSIRAFGDDPLSWRWLSASLGTALIGITYLLGRRMFASRLVGGLAALFVICDGLYLVDSRLALWEIFFFTFSAIAYLMLFRFAYRVDPFARRRTLTVMGFALGFALASKLGIPFITLLLMTACVAFLVLKRPGTPGASDAQQREARNMELYGALALIWGLSTIIFIVVFFPNYWFGWWHGLEDHVAFYFGEYRFQQKLQHSIHLSSTSPWWSWPFLLHPIIYYPQGEAVTTAIAAARSIRSIGNPILWWGALASIVVVTRQAITRKSMERGFLVLAYAVYLTIWIPFPRYEFIYYYMPSLYFGFMALALSLSDCWSGATRRWEEVALLIPFCPVLVLGLGITVGTMTIVVLAVAYLALTRRGGPKAGRMVCVLYVAATLILFVYFIPIWFALPLTPQQFGARMWLKGPGVADWR